MFQVWKINSDYPTQLRGGLPACTQLSGLYGNNTSPAVNLTSVSATVTNVTNVTTGTVESCTNYQPDVFFLSILEFLATFVIAYVLVEFKNSIFFPNIVSTQLSINYFCRLFMILIM